MLPITALAASEDLGAGTPITFAEPNEDGYTFTPSETGLYTVTFATTVNNAVSGGNLYVYGSDGDELYGVRSIKGNWATYCRTLPLQQGKPYTIKCQQGWATCSQYSLSVSKAVCPVLSSTPTGFSGLEDYDDNLFFQYTPTGSGWYTFSGSPALYLHTYDANFEGIDSGEAGDLGLSLYLKSGQTYYLSASPGTSGTIAVSPASFPALTTARSTTIKLGETFNYLTFTPTLSGSYTIKAETNNSYGVRYVYVFSNTQEYLAGEWDKEADYSAETTYNFTAGTTYYIGVHGADAESGVVTATYNEAPAGLAQWTNLYPANGATDVGYKSDAPAHYQITFDREITNDGALADVDLTSDGAFAIYRASDDALIYKPSQYASSDYKIVYQSENILSITPVNNHTLLEPDTEYYITMGEGFVRFKDGSTNSAIGKGEWQFTTKEASTVPTAPIISLSTPNTIQEGTPVSVKWDAVPGADKYLINVVSKGVPTFKDSPISSCEFRLPQLTVGEHEIWVVAENSIGKSAESNHITVTVIEEQVKLRAPEISLTAPFITEGDSSKAIWTAVKGADKYYVNVINTTTGKSLYKNYPVSDTSFQIQSIEAGEYEIYVQAGRGDTRSDESDHILLRVQSNKFTLGRDNNNFSNSNWKEESGFYGHKNYYIPKEVFNRLILNASPSITNSLKKDIEDSRDSKWGGCCYGIATTMALVYSDLLALSDISNVPAGTYYELPQPYTDDKLINSITYYQLSFQVTYQTKPHLYSTSKDNLSRVLKGMITNLTRDDISKDRILVLSYGYPDADGKTSAHAIIACNYIKNSDGSYTVKLYDENCWGTGEKFTDMRISEDFTTFDFTDANDNHVTADNFIYLEVSQAEYLHDIKPYSRELANNDAKVAMILPIGLDCVVENSSGERLVYEDGQFSGSMKVIDSWLHAQDTQSNWIVMLDESDSYTVTTSNHECDVEFYSDDDFLALTGVNIDRAVFALGDSITVDNGNDGEYNFSAYVSTREIVSANETNLVKLSAQATEPIQICLDEDKNCITASSSAPFTNVKGHSLVGTNTYTLVDLDNRSDKISFSTKVPTTSYNPSTSTTPVVRPNQSTTYAIVQNYPTGGRVTITPNSATKGATITLTATPDTGYELVTLTATDSNGNELNLTDKGNGKYTFTMPDSKVTISASFRPVQSTEVTQEPQTPVVSWTNPFTDVTADAWYYDAVKFVSENSLMNGLSSTVFAPDANLSRAQLAQILYNKEGKPAVSSASSFIDVAAGDWYTDAVTWAASQNIVGGYGDGQFGPNDNITREQLAVMLWRYAGEPASISELSFSDANQISNFALSAMRWAVEKGILNGKGNGILDPKGLATRAQVAQMFKNYLDN